jgi:hypothetical protein
MLHLPGNAMQKLAVQEMGRVVSRPSRIVIATHAFPLAVKRRFPKQTQNHGLSWYRFDADELEGLIREVLSPCQVSVKAICHLPRWSVGNRLGSFGVKLDRMLSRIPGLKYLTGTLLVASVKLPAPRNT